MSKEEIALHESFMKICIGLANVAKQRGDSPVGFIIVQNGIMIRW